MVGRREILVATTNAGKLREIIAIMDPLAVRWTTLVDHPGLPPATEDGATFAENARRKAAHYAARTRLWTLADDSGLEVDALDGAPGIYSARYAGPDGDDRANNARLLRELAGVPATRRTARFQCAVALGSDAGFLAEATGTVEGVILDAPRGANGFGYDPLFLIPHLGRTTAELDPDHKNALSHRGEALRRLRPRLAALLIGAR